MDIDHDSSASAPKSEIEMAGSCIGNLSAAKKSMSIYPIGHPECESAIDKLIDSVKLYSQTFGDLHIKIIGEEFFLFDKILPRESVVLHSLLHAMDEREIGGVFIRGMPERNNYIKLINMLNFDPKEVAEMVKADGASSISIGSITLERKGLWEEAEASRAKEDEAKRTKEEEQKKEEEKRENVGKIEKEGKTDIKDEESKDDSERIEDPKKEPTAPREAYFMAVDFVKEFMDEAVQAKRFRIGRAQKAILPLVNSVIENRSALLGLATLKSYDEYTSYHSVNVMILSLSIGAAIGLDREALMIVGLGALLHDIGKVTIPARVIQKSGPLTEEEWEAMRRHPAEGADILLSQPGIHPLSVLISYEHHVRYDMQGYPRIDSKQTQTFFSRMVEVADVYDAMTTHRPYQQARDPNQAIKILVNDSGKVFDPLMIKVFVAMMGIYPIGTLVNLSDGTMGLVIEQDNMKPLRPVVKILKDPDGKDIKPTIINMADPDSKGKGLEIVESINPQEASIDVSVLL